MANVKLYGYATSPYVKYGGESRSVSWMDNVTSVEVAYTCIHKKLKYIR